MRSTWSSSALTAIMLVALTVGSPGPSASAAGGSDLERSVFVHYPRTESRPDLVDQARQGAPQACPDPSTCSDNKWTGYRWPGTVAYEVNAAGSGVGAPGAATAVKASFDAWVDPTGGALTVAGGSGLTGCEVAGTTANGVNQVCWRDLTRQFPNAIAVTFVWGSRSMKQIVEADTVFNNGPRFSWTYTPLGACSAYADCNDSTGVTGTYDVRDIGTHEFGHFLGLFGDLYGKRDAELTMYGYGTTAELKKDSLGKGDCLGITAAYGGSCP